MVTWHFSERRLDPLTQSYKRYRKGECLSTDEKPTAEDTDIYNGSRLREMDTGKTYLYDAVSDVWRLFSDGESPSPSPTPSPEDVATDSEVDEMLDDVLGPEET